MLCASPTITKGTNKKKKSVDTLKLMMLNDNKSSSFGELCYSLNCQKRVGQKASPIEMFFGRSIKSNMPDQFTNEFKIQETFEKRVQKQIDIAQRKRQYSREQFKVGDEVLIRNNVSGRKWNILGKVIVCEEAAEKTYLQSCV